MSLAESESFSAIVFNSVTSTMDKAKELSQDPHWKNKIIAVFAREQTKGRGRAGSQWLQGSVSHQTENTEIESDIANCLNDEEDFLPLTIVIPANKIEIPTSWLTSLVGCALIDALKSTELYIQSLFPELPFLEQKNLYLKWPNDIVYFDQGVKKICGILTETTISGSLPQTYYIGIGLNFFNAPDLPEARSFVESFIQTKAEKVSDSKKYTKWIKSAEPKQIALRHFLETLEAELKEYLFYSRSTEQLKGLTLERSLPLGTILSVEKGTVRGGFRGLNDDGALLVDGSQAPIYSADVTVYQDPMEKQNLSSEIPQITKQNKEELKPQVYCKILLDLGNTNFHWGVALGKKAELFGNSPYAFFEEGKERELKSSLQDLVRYLIPYKSTRVKIVYSSVTSKKQAAICLEKLESFLLKLFPEMKFERREVVAAEIMDLASMPDAYRSAELGVDRALQIYFAKDRATAHKAKFGVFSIGTAFTSVIVTPDGELKESTIAPGMQMALDALHDFTEKLPKAQVAPMNREDDGVAWSTEKSLLRGSVTSIVGALVLQVEKHQVAHVALCGGSASFVAEELKELYKGKTPPFEFELVSNLELQILAKLELRKLDAYNPRTVTTGGFQQYDQSVQPLAQTMLRARINKRREEKLETRIEDFRKIGGRLENIGVGERLDAHLATNYPFSTRDTWHDRVDAGEVLIQQNSPRESTGAKAENCKFTKVKPTYRLKPYDQVWVFHPSEYEPDSLGDVKLIYDDSDVAGFCKPGNLVMHATGLYARNTFVNSLEKMGHGDAAPTHRIDRETSGLVLCARKPSSRSLIADAFREGQMKKMYLALTHGKRVLPEEFSVDLPIGEPENSKIRLKLWVNTPNAIAARTCFKELGKEGDYTLYACFPKTGRTNQIRIHLSAIGKWIVGDKMYHPDEEVFLTHFEHGLTDWVRERLEFPRHVLHNSAILGPSTFPFELGSAPIFCPMTEDIKTFPVMERILTQVGLKGEKEEENLLKDLFMNFANNDFNSAPVIGEEIL